MKKLLKSKRGMAMESAILFMLIIFSLCALLSAVTLTGHFQNKLDRTLLDSKVALDQIGENFLAGSITDENSEVDGYSYQISTESGITTFILTQGETVVLYIEKNSAGKATCWHYSGTLPTSDESTEQDTPAEGGENAENGNSAE